MISSDDGTLTMKITGAAISLMSETDYEVSNDEVMVLKSNEAHEQIFRVNGDNLKRIVRLVKDAGVVIRYCVGEEYLQIADTKRTCISTIVAE